MNAPAALPRSGCRKVDGFTLLEMMFALLIFLLLVASVFTLMSGVLQGASTLLDNQSRRDQLTALHEFMKKKFYEIPGDSSLASYQRGDGEGLTQNGIIFGNSNYATAIDAKVQPNGYYVLRLTIFSTDAAPGQPQDARQYLQTAVTQNDPNLVWRSLIKDIKTLTWKFQQANATDWATIWNNGKPNLIEFSLQPAGENQATTMDFWLVNLTPATGFAAGTAQPATP